jgi:hypothetical protein
MFYRTDLDIHTKRVAALFEEVCPMVVELYPDFKTVLAELLAEHHDDIELQPLGDVLLQEKLKMEDAQLDALRREEILSAEAMARVYRVKGRYPRKIHGYNYLDLLRHAIFKDCPEAQVISWVDKIDGCCEAIHDLFAGNGIFFEPVENYFRCTFNDLPGKYPLIKEVFSSGRNPFTLPKVFELREYLDHGRRNFAPHTAETALRSTSIPMYDAWKRVTVRELGIRPLINQVEFAPPQI